MGEHGNLLEIFGFGAGALSLGFSVFVAVSQLRVGSVPMTLFKGLLSVLCGALLTYAIVLLSICQASGELLALCCLCLLCAMSQALLFFVKSPPPRLSSASPLLLLLSQGILLVLVLPVNDPEALLVPLVATSTSLTGFLTLLCLFTRPVPAPLGYSSLTTPDGRVPSEEDTASLAGFLSFAWVNSLLDRGQQHPLEEEDLPNLSMRDQMGTIVGDWMMYKESDSRQKAKKSLLETLLKFTKSYGLFQIFMSVLTTTLDFANPFFINRILVLIQERNIKDSLFTDPSASTWTAPLLLLGGLFLASLVREILYGQIELSGRHWGIQLRSILVHEILSKSLRRATASSAPKSTNKGGEDEDEEESSTASTGKIVSLMSADVGEIRGFVTDLHRPLVDTPLTIIIGVSGLWQLLGPSAIAGLAVVVLSSPASGLALKSIYKIFKKTKLLRDKRIQATNEVLQGIRIIKYMSWEPKFIQKIQTARETELTSRLYGLLGYLGLIVISWGSSILVTFTCFFFYTVVAGHTLDAATAFTCITLLGIVSGYLNDISQTVSEVLNIKIVIQRLQDFLGEEEIEEARPTHRRAGSTVSRMPPSEIHPRLGFEEDASFEYYVSSKKPKKAKPLGQKRRWWFSRAATTEETEPLLNSDDTVVTAPVSQAFILTGLNLKFPEKQLTSIIGATGAGKTSLLMAILGEMKRTRGSRLLPDPSFSDITDREMLHHGIAYVAQTSWLLNATIRDNILFGAPYDQERYMKTLRACALIRDLETLESGDMTEIGEKGVNLSGGQKQRISLARATYSRAAYVLLDDPLSAVDAPTARHLFEECILSLLKNRTVLLVSHSASLVVPRSAFVVAMKNGTVVASGSPQALTARSDIADLVAADLESTPIATTPKLTQPTPVDDPAKLTGGKTNLVDKEGRATGSVQFSTYVTYLKACGGWLFIFWIALAFIITTAADFLSSWWIQQWTDSLKYDSEGSQAGAAHSPLYYITVFGLISVVELVALMFRFVIQFYGGWHASKMLHHKLLDAILGAPLRFFEVTPVGRLINRFSKDLSDIDSGVMFTVVRFGTLMVAAISNLIVVTYVAPVFLCATVFQIFYHRIANRYLASSRELKRIESVSSSPIYAQFSETLNGLETIRAYNSQNRVIEDIQHKVDANHRAFFYLFAANRWLYFRNAILSGTIVFMAGFSIIFSGVTAGWAGLAFTFASQLTSKMSAMVQTHASLEMSMNSVERVEEYSRTEQEPPAIVEENRPPENWPQHGSIVFKDLSVRYDKDLPLVLKNVSFAVNPKEKIGIVGRTGAGKSTVSLALFRILPFANGTIEIDGVDINQIGIRDLRSKLTVIAQDATLFEGTIRSNLDPVDEHVDADIWKALKQSHFLETFQKRTLDGLAATADNLEVSHITLEDRVEENGSNFSHGQRQLLCLARALLRESKIIFLDEATASVDKDTDAKIQDTIRTQFNTATILTVAHRLKTVIDYDRILVLDQGSIAEFGAPHELLTAQGIFDSMCRESGEYQELVALAKKEHELKLASK